MKRDELVSRFSQAVGVAKAENIVSEAESFLGFEDREEYTPLEIRDICDEIETMNDGYVWEIANELRVHTHTQQRFETILENIPDPTVVVEFSNRTPVVNTFNKEFSDIFGVAPEAASGESLTELIVPENEDDPSEFWLRDDETEREVQRITDDGERRTFLLRTAVETTIEGEAEGYGIYTDITERKRRTQHLKETTEQIGLAGKAADLRFWRYEFPGDTLEYLAYGTHEDDLYWEDQSTDYDEYISAVHPEDRPTVESALQAHWNGDTEIYETEHRLQSGDGDWIWIRDVGRVIEHDDHGDPLRMIGVDVNIDDIKEREQILQKQNERLDQFASVVSHDLRNPLGIAETYLDFAEETGTAEDFETVRDAHERMRSMIDELLTLARAGVTVEEKEQISLSEHVASAWDTAMTQDVTLENDVPAGVTLEANPDLFSHILENLFRNAKDHNEPPLTVTVGILEGSNSISGFYVEDDGEGIPEADRDQIFDQGFTTGDGGTGVGLSIVSELVEAHGWDISVTDGTDGGARFEIRTST